MSGGSHLAITISDDEEEWEHPILNQTKQNSQTLTRPPVQTLNCPQTQSQLQTRTPTQLVPGAHHTAVLLVPEDLTAGDAPQSANIATLSHQHPALTSQLQTASDLKSRPLKKRYTEPYFRPFQVNDDKDFRILNVPHVNVAGSHAGSNTLFTDGQFSMSKTGKGLASEKPVPAGQAISPSLSLCPQNGTVYSSKDGVYYQRVNPSDLPTVTWKEMPKTQAQVVQDLARKQSLMLQHLREGKAHHVSPNVASAIKMSIRKYSGKDKQSKDNSLPVQSEVPKEKQSKDNSLPVPSEVPTCLPEIPAHLMELAAVSILTRDASETDSNHFKLRETVERVVEASYREAEMTSTHSKEETDISRVSTPDSVIIGFEFGGHPVDQAQPIEAMKTDNPCTKSNDDTRDNDRCTLTILETYSLRDRPEPIDKDESDLNAAMDLSKTSSVKQAESHCEQMDQNLSVVEGSAAAHAHAVSETQEAVVDIKPTSSCPLDELSRKAFYQCCYESCTFSTVHPSDFEVHMADSHPDSDVFMCVHCGHAASAAESLIDHLHEHVRDDLDKTTLTCTYSPCLFKTSKPDDLLRHIHVDHQSEDYHMCCRCDKVFENVLDLLLHLKGNFLSVVKCPHCTAKDVTKRNIVRHINNQHPGQGKMVSVFRYIVCKERSLTQWPLSLSLLDDKHVSVSSYLSPLKLPKSRTGTSKELHSPEMPNLTNDRYPKASEDPLLIKSGFVEPVINPGLAQDYVPIMSVTMANSEIEVEKIASQTEGPDATETTSFHSQGITSSFGGSIVIKTEPQDSGYDLVIKHEPQEIKQEPMETEDNIKRNAPCYMSPTSLTAENKSLLQKVNVCNRCDFYTASNGAIYRHLKSAHKIDDMFQCSECLRCVSQDDVIEHHTTFHPTADENYVPTSLNHGYRIKYMHKSVYKAELKKQKKWTELNSETVPPVPVKHVATGLMERFNEAKEGDVVKLSSLESSLLDKMMKAKKKKSSESTKESSSSSVEAAVEGADDPDPQQTATETVAPVKKKVLKKAKRRRKSNLGPNKKKRKMSNILKPEPGKRSREEESPRKKMSKKLKHFENEDQESQPEDDAEQFEENSEQPEACTGPAENNLESSITEKKSPLRVKNSQWTTRNHSMNLLAEGYIANDVTPIEDLRVVKSKESNNNVQMKDDDSGISGHNQSVSETAAHLGDNNQEANILPNVDSPPCGICSTVNQNREQQFDLEKPSKVKTPEKKVLPNKRRSYVKKNSKTISVKEEHTEQGTVASCLDNVKAHVKTPGKVKKIKPVEDTGPNLSFSQVNFDDPNYEFRCKYCTYRKGTLDRFLHHTYYHFHYRPYACGFCSYKAFSHNRILTHINTDHPTKAKNPIVKRVENEKAEARCQKTAMICFIPKDIEDVSLRIRLEKKRERMLLKKQMKKEQGGGEIKIKMEPNTKKGSKKTAPLKTSIRKGQGKIRTVKKVQEGSYLCPYCRTKRPLRTWTKLVIEVCYHIHYKPFTCSYCSDCDTASSLCLQRHHERKHPKKKIVIKEQRDPKKEFRLKQLLQRSVDMSKKYRQELKVQEMKEKAKKGKKKAIKKESSLQVASKEKTAKIGQTSVGSSETPGGVATNETALEPNISNPETKEGTSLKVNTEQTKTSSPEDRTIKKAEHLFREVRDDYGSSLYECLKCDYTIRNLKSMYTHSYRHQPKIFKCAYCDLTSYPRSAILWHQKKLHRRLKASVINLSNLK